MSMPSPRAWPEAGKAKATKNNALTRETPNSFRTNIPLRLLEKDECLGLSGLRSRRIESLVRFLDAQRNRKGRIRRRENQAVKTTLSRDRNRGRYRNAS